MDRRLKGTQNHHGALVSGSIKGGLTMMVHPVVFSIFILPGIGLTIEELRAKRGVPFLSVFMIAIGLFGLGTGVATFLFGWR